MQDLQLKRSYTFWFTQESNTENFEQSLRRIGSFSTAREFWGYYAYMARPDKMPEGSQFFLFQEAIRPQWEDPQNQEGGRFVLRIKHGWENRVWEELILSYLADDHEFLNAVCGMTANSKKNFLLISIWVKDTSKSQQTYDDIQKWLIAAIGLQNKLELEYIHHPKK